MFIVCLCVCTRARVRQVLFYHEAQTLLAPLRPMTKFVSVKGVVFVMFWQARAVCVSACVRACA